jgi:MOSC domain-containing protein YiiM
VASLAVDLEGIVGNRHRGWTRGADARVPYLKRGTTIRNERQLSIVSLEELAAIARLLDIPTLEAAWIGANVVLEGVPHLSYLPRGTHLFSPAGAILIVTDQNAPCTLAGEAITLHIPGRPDIKAAFPKVAQGMRGVVATVEHPGAITAGDDITARVPMQWVYPSA